MTAAAATGAEPKRDFTAERKLVGTHLGRYIVGPRLGAGGTASVYLGRLEGSAGFERFVALKVVHDHLAGEREFLDQFLDEANLLVKLHHPAIVQVFELHTEGDASYLAMEYLEGHPLSDVLAELGRLPPEVVALVGARIADGLHYAHNLHDEDGTPLGLVHRDVSPQNIFLTYEGRAKLIDFGIARAQGRLARTTVGRVKGKYSYMAPEQMLSNDFDARADIYGLGATLYEAAVGTRPFGGDEAETLQKAMFESVPDPAERLPGFPNELTRILRKALASEPEQRFSTAGELARELRDFVGERETAVERQLVGLLSERFAEQRRQRAEAVRELRELGRTNSEGAVSLAAAAPPRKRWLAAAAVVAVAVIVAGVGLFAANAREPEAPAATDAEITLDITTQPAVESARIEVDGKVISARPARVRLPHGDRPVEVVVTAPGYETARVTPIPDRDHFLILPLREAKTDEPPAATGSSAPASSAANDNEARAKPGTKPGAKPGKAPGSAPGGTTGSKKPPGGSGAGKPDPLVTDYPF